MEGPLFIRSALFVPGNRPDRIDKAVNSEADMVIIDLEDAVAITEKSSARSIVREKLEKYRDRLITVRVNALETGMVEEDLSAVVGPGLDMIMLPKVQTPEDIKRISSLLLHAERKAGLQEGTVRLIGLIETALGVEKSYEIASTHIAPSRLYTLAFGAADFCLDMGIQLSNTGKELDYPRAKIAIACRAGGLNPPLDTPFMINIKDKEGLEADILRARCYGFGGKMCIHPIQIEPCNRLFSPSEEEVAFAKRVISAFEAAEKKGTAALQVDGKFIDYPVVEQARRILKMAGH